MTYAIAFVLAVGVAFLVWGFSGDRALRARYPGPRDAPYPETTGVMARFAIGAVIVVLAILLALGWGLWALFI